MQNQEFEESHAQEYILLIDDPVSSFDIENKVGIMSFLKYQLGLFLLWNINTKAIVMTHDLLTFYDLDKIYEELIENCNEKFSGNKMKFNRLEMAKQNIKKCSWLFSVYLFLKWWCKSLKCYFLLKMQNGGLCNLM